MPDVVTPTSAREPRPHSVNHESLLGKTGPGRRWGCRVPVLSYLTGSRRQAPLSHGTVRPDCVQTSRYTVHLTTATSGTRTHFMMSLDSLPPPSAGPAVWASRPPLRTAMTICPGGTLPGGPSHQSPCELCPLALVGGARLTRLCASREMWDGDQVRLSFVIWPVLTTALAGAPRCVLELQGPGRAFSR